MRETLFNHSPVLIHYYSQTMALSHSSGHQQKTSFEYASAREVKQPEAVM
jgi:hypothetical protein